MLDPKTKKKFEKVFPFTKELGKHYDYFMDSLIYNQIEADTILLDEYKKCSNVVFVLSGLIRVYKLSEEGKEITLYRMGRGETCVLTVSCILGVGDVVFPVAASAEQYSEVVLMPVEAFKSFFFEIPALQKFYFTAMAAKFYSVLNLVGNITFKKTSDRLLDLLITKTANGTYPLYSTHEAIASELGTAREVVSRLLKEMEGKGLVTLSRGKIVYHSKLKKLSFGSVNKKDTAL
ncbi:MAG: Crp/Fnr family transcriptional regulator [Clostridiaceae bacterium]|nr:Crp/Fnr family transcriptional regulator [Clostridiaceae bacterium]